MVIINKCLFKHTLLMLLGILLRTLHIYIYVSGVVRIPTKNIFVETLVCLSRIIIKIEEEDFAKMFSNEELVIEVYLNNYTQFLVKNTVRDHIDEPYSFFKP